jgi:hypothetical protein
MLKFLLANKGEYDALPEAVRALYAEKNGRFELQVDGVVEKNEFDSQTSKLNEFRDNNRVLHTKVTDFETRFKDVDPDKYRTATTELEKLKAQGVTKSDDIEQVIARAVEKATGPLLDRVGKIEGERNQATAALHARERDDALWAIAVKAGVREEAKDDFLHRASRVWQRSEKGELVAMRGDTPIYSKQRGRTTEPLGMDEWATDWLPAEAAHLYKVSGGSGAVNDKGPQGGAGLISADPLAVGSNLEAIAKGTAKVAGTAA